MLPVNLHSKKHTKINMYGHTRILHVVDNLLELRLIKAILEQKGNEIAVALHLLESLVELGKYHILKCQI